MTIEGKELALACARAADEIKAENIRVWDLRGISSLTDFMVVCSGASMPQLRAIRREVAERIKDAYDVTPLHVEGNAETRWVVLDFIDVMVHVMHQEMRDFYGIEDLWKDAREIPWQEAA